MSPLLDSPACVTPRPSSPADLGVPAYAYPTLSTMWSALGDLDRGSVIILNPASGAGTRVDPVYVETLERLRPGPRCYGYVDTDYGRRPVGDVVADVDNYQAWYRPDGMFLDQVASDLASLDHLTAITREVRARGLGVALNPGQPLVDRRLVELADHVVNFEGTAALYVDTDFPHWVSEFEAARWWHLVYGVADIATMERVLALAADRNAGLAFVTDGDMPNPWDHLPHYWSEEVDRVGR